MRLAGYRAIITGAGSGIGQAVTQRFLEEGARVVAVVRDAADAGDLVKYGAVVVVGDVSQYSTAERSVAAAATAFGGLDVYVANAGIWDFQKRISKQSPEELGRSFDEIFGVNVLGALYGARAAFAPLQESCGSVIMTGSNASFRGGGGGALYTASKFAVRGLVQQLATEFAPSVRVNGVAPGATNTGLSGVHALGQGVKKMNADASRLQSMASRMPLQRISRPEEHASLYVLLASREESSFVTGAMFVSDGGLIASV